VEDIVMTTATLSWRPELTIDTELRRFLNWTLVWIILANIGYMVLWTIGAPPRWWEIQK
jgi:hypothetical protein